MRLISRIITLANERDKLKHDHYATLKFFFFFAFTLIALLSFSCQRAVASRTWWFGQCYITRHVYTFFFSIFTLQNLVNYFYWNFKKYILERLISLILSGRFGWNFVSVYKVSFKSRKQIFTSFYHITLKIINRIKL